MTSEAQLGIHRTAAWIAGDLGVSQSCVTSIRRKLIQSGEVDNVAYFTSRDGKFITNHYYANPDALK